MYPTHQWYAYHIYIIQQICKTYIWNIFIQMVNMQLITIHKHRSPLDLILESIDQALALRWALSYRRLPRHVDIFGDWNPFFVVFLFFVNIPKDSLFGAWHRGWHPIIRTLTYFLAVNIPFPLDNLWRMSEPFLCYGMRNKMQLFFRVSKLRKS